MVVVWGLIYASVALALQRRACVARHDNARTRRFCEPREISLDRTPLRLFAGERRECHSTPGQRWSCTTRSGAFGSAAARARRRGMWQRAPDGVHVPGQAPPRREAHLGHESAPPASATVER